MRRTKHRSWQKQLGLILSLLLLSSCDLANRVEFKAAQLNSYEQRVLVLAKENRLLKAEISNLNAEIETLKAKNNFLKIKSGKMDEASRDIASVAPPVDAKNDLVKYSIYRWSAKQLLQIGETEFAKKNYEKSAQFFKTLHQYHSNNDPSLKDDFLFQLGVSSYHSGEHYDWAIQYLNELLVKYPTSPHYRESKLWMALAKLKLGRHQEFFDHVEEFRLKYRNTAEWKILRDHYEKIRETYKN